eukprot:m.86263 g.86263  ORF g.86263 m.86263 type:complete len:127 (-) comp8275_c0_seq2:2013-2393(-)
MTDELGRCVRVGTSSLRWIALQGFHLLTFAEGGVSHAVSKAFALTKERRGCSLSVEPIVDGTAERVASEYTDIAMRLPVNLDVGMNAPRMLFYNTAHVVVALPGMARRQPSWHKSPRARTCAFVHV